MAIINSMLDNDAYKFYMQNAIMKLFPDVDAEYTYINRGGTVFPKGFEKILGEEIQHMRNLRLTNDEFEYLDEHCNCFDEVYLDALMDYKYDPSNILLSLKDGKLGIKIRGPWHRAILWEVPLMAMISELYLKDKPVQFSKFNNLMKKAKGYNTIPLADFGTRRRHSYATQRKVIEAFRLHCSSFLGTSNVHFAHRYGIKPIGTQAHEWFQAHGAIYGYKLANKLALEHWMNVYQGQLGIALSDTFTTKAFFNDFDGVLARVYDGVRQDSGGPLNFFVDMVEHYKSLGIDPHTKKYIFSDGLDFKSAEEIYDYTMGYNVSFGIGTSLTNDVGLHPLNMVIKLTGINTGDGWVPAIKLSDSPGKHTGDKDEIELCKRTLGLE